MSQQVFEKLESLAAESGIEPALDFLAEHFRSTGDYFQLFEALKMKVRHTVGLPILYSTQPDGMDESTQQKLEDGLLTACREVGTGLVESGKLREGWMYLQPLGDRELSERLIREFPTSDDHLDEIIDIAVAGGAAPEYGYELLMDRFGTCNAITAYDTQISQLGLDTQRKLAKLLVHHLYDELVDNVRRHIEQEEKALPDCKQLAELTGSRSWLQNGGGHHIDTTHLASVVRIGRIVDDQPTLELLLELTEYGNRLAADFHYEGSPPFEKTYTDHLIYYSGLLGKDVDRAARHFEQKSKSANNEPDRVMADHVLVDFLSRAGKSNEAIKIATERLIPEEPDPMAMHQPMSVPEIFGLAKTKEDRDLLKEFYRQRGDALGFATGLLNHFSG